MPRSQERAIAYVAMLATGEPADPSWRVTLHFHPERLVSGTPILERMARDGVYRSQFETGTSNGGLTVWPGSVPPRCGRRRKYASGYVSPCASLVSEFM
jgi:Protein of unknown function (DUF3626)